MGVMKHANSQRRATYEYLPAARILYSDNKPLSVPYGSILKEHPLHLYVEADIRQPQALATAAAKYLAEGLQKLAWMSSASATFYRMTCCVSLPSASMISVLRARQWQ